jgi:ribosome-binding ATPase YchF (GTP1/OBG family)
MENLFNLSGNAVLESTSDYKIKKMESGLAVLTSVIPHTGKKSNKLGVKLSFSAFDEDAEIIQDELVGHDEFVSMSTADRFSKTFRKLAYLIEHSENEALCNAFKNLPNILEPVTENNLPIQFSTNEELENIRKKFADESITYIWDTNGKQVRYACKFTKTAEEYMPMLQNALTLGINGVYELELKMEGNFQRLKSIKPA